MANSKYVNMHYKEEAQTFAASADAYKQVKADNAEIGGIVTIPEMFDEMKKLTPGITRPSRIAREESEMYAKNPFVPAKNTDELEEQIHNLYESASKPTTTSRRIKQTTEQLANLKKPELVRIAERIGMVGMGSKSRQQIQQQIKHRINTRRGAYIRAQLI